MNAALIRRLCAALLALLMLLPAMAFGEAEEEEVPLGSDVYNEDDALNEEDTSNVYQPETGTYEWYMLPADAEEGHAYVDIYPVDETVKAVKNKCTFTFTLEEVGGVDFTLNAVTLISFIEDEEIDRYTMSPEEVADWCEDGMLGANESVNYTATVERDGITAMAISVIGTDATDEELEFHSIVFFE